MKASKANAAQARRIYNLCSSNGSVDGEKLRKAIATLKSTKPRGYLEILTALGRLVRLEIESRQVLVTSAEPLDGATQTKIKSDLNSKHGNDLSFEFKVDPTVLGGLVVRVGDDVWDGSVRSRLDRLAASF